MGVLGDAVGLLDKLQSTRSLELDEYELLVAAGMRELASSSPRSPLAAEAATRADADRRAVYGTAIYIRGLVEITNHCRNNCRYCGIRRDNAECERYRIAPADIVTCAKMGYDLGFRTVVLQGGEDGWFTDARLAGIIAAIKDAHEDMAVTLSMGERSRKSYHELRSAGADRYLLRHETADKCHYERLHPAEMSYNRRMRCLSDLREEGFAIGAGFMVGSPFQTSAHLAADVKFVETLAPEMCGIGPFVPHRATPFAAYPQGSAELTCLLLSILRLIKPNALLPATTALATSDPFGREKGVLAGANVIMPNLSPQNVREKYELYDGKAHAGAESAEGLADLRARMCKIGYHVVVDRGDPASAR